MKHSDHNNYPALEKALTDQGQLDAMLASPSKFMRENGYSFGESDSNRFDDFLRGVVREMATEDGGPIRIAKPGENGLIDVLVDVGSLVVDAASHNDLAKRVVQETNYLLCLSAAFEVAVAIHIGGSGLILGLDIVSAVVNLLGVSESEATKILEDIRDNISLGNLSDICKALCRHGKIA